MFTFEKNLTSASDPVSDLQLAQAEAEAEEFNRHTKYSYIVAISFLAAGWLVFNSKHLLLRILQAAQIQPNQIKQLN